MPENREADGRFEKGKSGNPGGRPKKFRELEAALEKLEPDCDSVLRKALQGDDIRWALRAVEIVYGYRYGKPAQAITGDDGGPIQVAGWDLGKLTDEQFRAVVDALKATRAP